SKQLIHFDPAEPNITQQRKRTDCTEHSASYFPLSSVQLKTQQAELRNWNSTKPSLLGKPSSHRFSRRPRSREKRRRENCFLSRKLKEYPSSRWCCRLTGSGKRFGSQVK
ncbi:hypothetical protein ANANG_G00024300, partial [Anguilla anguilla]